MDLDVDALREGIRFWNALANIEVDSGSLVGSSTAQRTACADALAGLTEACGHRNQPPTLKHEAGSGSGSKLVRELCPERGGAPGIARAAFFALPYAASLATLIAGAPPHFSQKKVWKDSFIHTHQEVVAEASSRLATLAVAARSNPDNGTIEDVDHIMRQADAWMSVRKVVDDTSETPSILGAVLGI